MFDTYILNVKTFVKPIKKRKEKILKKKYIYIFNLKLKKSKTPSEEEIVDAFQISCSLAGRHCF